MWNGYLGFNGIPLINAEATEAYVHNYAPGLPLKPVFRSDTVHIADGVPPYRTPLLDEQPWVNPTDPITHDFLGLYPLSIEGLDDSTMQASVTQYLSEGGAIGLQRHASKPIRVSGVLAAKNIVSAHAGLNWLKAALTTAECTTCQANELRYFLAKPDVCELDFGDVVGEGRAKFGGMDIATLRYRWLPDDNVPVQMPSHARWEGSFQEGTQFLWGKSPIGSITPIEIYGPVAPIRRNYVINPSLRQDTQGWLIGGNVISTWQPAGGVDGGSYLQVLSAVQPEVGGIAFGEGDFGAGDFGPSSSLTVRPYSSGSFNEGLYGGAESSGIAVTSGVAIDDGTSMVFSVALRSAYGSTVTITLRNSSGIEIGSTTLQPGYEWNRAVTFGLTDKDGLVIAEFTGDGPFDIDQALMEIGAADLGYFDGSTGGTDDYVASWDGIPEYSSSNVRWVGTAEVAHPDSNYRPFITIVAGGAIALDLVWDDRQRRTPEIQMLPIERRLYDVGCTSGPKVIQEIDLGAQGAFIHVEFELVAGNPAAYSTPIAISTEPIATAPFTDPDTVIPLLETAWLADPNVLAVTLPPSAPIILNPAIENITTWTRYYVPIPASAVADWSASIPTIGIESHENPVPQVRFRFTPNPFSYAPEDVDPLAYCSEFIVSYLPAVTRLEVDGVSKRATASRGGSQPLSADHLLYGADGAPISWPELSCGIPHLLTIDIPPTTDVTAFGVDMVVRQKAA